METKEFVIVSKEKGKKRREYSFFLPLGSRVAENSSRWVKIEIPDAQTVPVGA